jgi:hypothetical protein
MLHGVLAWEFFKPDQDFWKNQDPGWLAVLVTIGNERAARDNAPAPSVREQLGLPPEPTSTEAQRAATRARVLAALEARQAEVRPTV